MLSPVPTPASPPAAASRSSDAAAAPSRGGFAAALDAAEAPAARDKTARYQAGEASPQAQAEPVHPPPATDGDPAPRLAAMAAEAPLEAEGTGKPGAEGTAEAGENAERAALPEAALVDAALPGAAMPGAPPPQPVAAGEAAAGMAMAATLAPTISSSSQPGGAAAASARTEPSAGVPDQPGAAEAAQPPAPATGDATRTQPDIATRAATADTTPEPGLAALQPGAQPDAAPVPAASPHQALAAAPPPEAPAAAQRPYAHAAAVPAQQLAPVILAQVAKGGDASRLIVQLRPAELGGVEVAVEASRDGRTQVRILVERPETLMLLARDRGAIEQALQAAGIDTKADTLSMSLGEPGQRGGQGQGGGRQGAEDGRGPAQPWVQRGAAGADMVAIAPQRLVARGLLDVAL